MARIKMEISQGAGSSSINLLLKEEEEAAAAAEEEAMEIDEPQGTIPFQLQFDKPIASQIKMAEWNPEKDLLAMVTEDSKILLHRFNWQRLWTLSPGRCITSLCWRPDGKAIAVGLEDGTISLHDVENGKLLKSIKSHTVAVVCLNWEEDGRPMGDDGNDILTYEDRTSRFFPPAPRIPRIAGLSSGDAGFMDENEESFHELSTSHQRFNILCSGDQDGIICFSIFGIFPIGKINIHKFPIRTPSLDKQIVYRLLDASIYKVALSNNLCELIVLCFGELVEDTVGQNIESSCKHDSSVGLHCLLLNTSIFRNSHISPKNSKWLQENLTGIYLASCWNFQRQMKKFAAVSTQENGEAWDPQEHFSRENQSFDSGVE